MDMKNNMDMNNTNIKAKKVFFAEGTKEFDGTSQKNVQYYALISKFLKGDIRNSIDVYRIVKDDRELLSFFFVQVVITLLKLKLAKKREESPSSFSNEKCIVPKDAEEESILNEWDTFLWNAKARLKATTSNDAGVLRHGSRDFSHKFTTKHIMYLQKLGGILLKTRKLLQENPSV